MDRARDPANITIADIYNLIKDVNLDLGAKISEVKIEITDIKKSLENQIEEIKTRVENLEGANKNLIEQQKLAERNVRRNNLVISGIPEEVSETQEILLEIICEFAIQKLKVSLLKTDINDLFRIGKNRDNPRPILLSCISYLKKKEILRKCTNLKGYNISVNDDLNQSDREEKRILVNSLKQARKEKKTAVIKGLKIVIEGVPYTASEIKNNRVGTETDGQTEEQSQESIAQKAAQIETRSRAKAKQVIL